MTDGDKLTSTIFAEGMALLAERWNREISPTMSRLYATSLRDLGASLFMVGIERAVTELTFFPSAKEIRDLAQPGISPEIRGGEVFGKVLAAGVHTPHGRRWDLDTVETQCGEAARRALVSIGGGRRLSDMTDDAFPFVLRDFTAAFAEYDRELSSRRAVDRLLTAGSSAPRITAGNGPRPKALGAGPSPIAAVIAAALPAGTFNEGGDDARQG